MGTLLTPVAFDIETTGFAVDARVTTVGIGLPLGCRVFLEVGERRVDPEPLAENLEDRFDMCVNLSTHAGETALLSAVGTFLEETVAPRDYLVMAYNGEHWSGGFDLPFLRTRYARHNQEWPFDDVPYADLMPLIADRFNTTVDDTECLDLEGVYDALIDGSLSAADPFETSEQAVDAHDTGEFATLLAHNIADVQRTRALAKLAQRYCSRGDFDVKSLTPATRDPTLTRRG
ncbi:MAG: hypothetical protein ABEH64_12530 [Salinirussus sp.]